jgi:hypothetical protein
MENNEDEWQYYEDLQEIYKALNTLIPKLKEKTDYKEDLINIKLEVFGEIDEMEMRWHNDLMNEGEGDVFELIQEENYYDDIWRKENGYE